MEKCLRDSGINKCVVLGVALVGVLAGDDPGVLHGKELNKSINPTKRLLSVRLSILTSEGRLRCRILLLLVATLFCPWAGGQRVGL